MRVEGLAAGAVASLDPNRESGWRGHGLGNEIAMAAKMFFDVSLALTQVADGRATPDGHLHSLFRYFNEHVRAGFGGEKIVPISPDGFHPPLLPKLGDRMEIPSAQIAPIPHQAVVAELRPDETESCIDGEVKIRRADRLVIFVWQHREGRSQWALYPPSIGIFVPVTYEEASLSRKTTAPPRS